MSFVTCWPTFLKNYLNFFMEFLLGFSIWAKGGNCPPFHGKVVAEGVFKDGKHVVFSWDPRIFIKISKKTDIDIPVIRTKFVFNEKWLLLLQMWMSKFGQFGKWGGLVPWCLWGFLLFSTACGKPNFGDWQLGICSSGKVQSKNEKKHHESRMETPLYLGCSVLSLFLFF